MISMGLAGRAKKTTELASARKVDLASSGHFGVGTARLRTPCFGGLVEAQSERRDFAPTSSAPTRGGTSATLFGGEPSIAPKMKTAD
jgi:hypothetical protein